MITAPPHSGDVYLVTRGFLFYKLCDIIKERGVLKTGVLSQTVVMNPINAFVPQFTHSNRRPVLFTEPALDIHLSSQCIWKSTSTSIMLTNKAVFKLWTLVLIDWRLSVVLAHSGSLWRTVLCAVWQYTHTQLSHQLFFFWRRRPQEWNVSRVSSPISSLLLTYKKEWFDWFKLYEWQNDLYIVETGLQGCHFIPKKSIWGYKLWCQVNWFFFFSFWREGGPESF